MSVYDEIEIEDLDFDPETQSFYYPCPCGDKFQISLVSYYDYVLLLGNLKGFFTHFFKNLLILIFFLIHFRKSLRKVKILLLAQVAH